MKLFWGINLPLRSVCLQQIEHGLAGLFLALLRTEFRVILHFKNGSAAETDFLHPTTNPALLYFIVQITYFKVIQRYFNCNLRSTLHRAEGEDAASFPVGETTAGQGYGSGKPNRFRAGALVAAGVRTSPPAFTNYGLNTPCFYIKKQEIWYYER